jgi:uncharacterized RDD family membrane protein YckC
MRRLKISHLGTFKFSFWTINFDVIDDDSLEFYFAPAESYSAPVESNYTSSKSRHSAADLVDSAAWLGYIAAWVAILSPLGPKKYLLILPLVKKLLDVWTIFLMKIVPHCFFFYFLNMQ